MGLYFAEFILYFKKCWFCSVSARDGWGPFFCLELGFGFWYLARVGSWINKNWLGSSLGLVFFSFLRQKFLYWANIWQYLSKRISSGSGRVDQKGLGSGQIWGRVLAQSISRALLIHTFGLVVQCNMTKSPKYKIEKK